MNNKDFKSLQKEIKDSIQNGNADSAFISAQSLIRVLFQEKDYQRISDIYHWQFLMPKDKLFMFEMAFSLDATSHSTESETIYEFLLGEDPRNTAILNNLSNIKKKKGDIDLAWTLIQRAFTIDTSDEIISRNYKNLQEIIEERQYIDSQFQIAIGKLAQENEFVKGKLLTFVKNTRKDPSFRDNQLPIPNWKFKILLETDEQKAESLRDQWLKKGYIRRTEKRGEYQEHIYHLNPYINDALKSNSKVKFPQKWIDGVINIDADYLASIEYFNIIEIVQKVRKKFREILLRDIDELYLNYVIKNRKTVVVLAGSVVETVLIYHCEKKEIAEIQYNKNGKIITKKLYDADLGDLLSYFKEKNIFGDLLVNMGNISRISRNFVHPGKELRDTEELDPATVDLCFLSAIQIIKRVC